MSRSPIRLLVALLATAVALVWALPGRSAAVPLDATASGKAATYLVGRLKSDAAGKYLESLDSFSNTLEPSASFTADGVLALVATGGHAADVAAMDAWLKTQASGYATSGGAAGKLALAAVAAGSDPRSYGGVDLIAKVLSSAQADGSLAAWGPDAFTQSLGVLALARSGTAVPASVASYLVGMQAADGSYGYKDYQSGAYVADPDSTAIALQALAALAGSDADAKAAAVKARGWLVANRTAQGYWQAYSPVNSTGYAGIALMLVGDDVSASASWMLTQQRSDGGLPATLGGTDSDVLATVQGVLLLAGESLLSVGPGGVDRVSLTQSSTTPSSPATSATPSATAPSSTAPSSTAPSATAPTSTAPSATASATSTGGTVSVPTITLSSTSLAKGQRLVVTGRGFTGAVTGTVKSDPIDLGTRTVDANGTVVFSFSTASLAVGTHTVTLASSDGAVVTATFTVTAAAATLSSTGSDVSLPLTTAALLALVLGAGLVVAGRRRAQ